ncbi:hypothetical protein M422DRAFT_35715 [Sphaerobolus stellatus SS14]|uniref:Uncharacterized protein n=1 Tax=Sphaerobolus stellatus (strain SS14) TaxID=990650 RepID=A0A0C9UDE2_SPHS4|nr:hypothetical protein M422DRAFT_35715 [Sphaerobolus stellatus SS14]
MCSSGASGELSELLSVAGDDMIIAYRNKYYNTQYQSSSPVRESSLRKRPRSASIESIESFIGDQRSTGSHINNLSDPIEESEYAPFIHICLH